MLLVKNFCKRKPTTFWCRGGGGGNGEGDEEEEEGEEKKISLSSLGLNGKDGFGSEAEAWAKWAERQTSVTAFEQGSISEGRDVGGGEES